MKAAVRQSEDQGQRCLKRRLVLAGPGCTDWPHTVAHWMSNTCTERAAARAEPEVFERCECSHPTRQKSV
ncbi:hypothetical protein K0M31_012978 [Melipona bicolor]|uniref:Uncharacterized protein n=1 Tax=Melipona bicolor TaxID=60889 RepID=A0AA40KGV1_9HYME|nr:hypothetical protein K0M31_012978 [Melipona bicolor]